MRYPSLQQAKSELKYLPKPEIAAPLLYLPELVALFIRDKYSTVKLNQQQELLKEHPDWGGNINPEWWNQAAVYNQTDISDELAFFPSGLYAIFRCVHTPTKERSWVIGIKEVTETRLVRWLQHGGPNKFITNTNGNRVGDKTKTGTYVYTLIPSTLCLPKLVIETAEERRRKMLDEW